MSVIDRLLKDLFPEKQTETSPVKEVLVREMINRNDLFIDSYNKWKDQEMHLGLIEHLRENSMLKSSNPDAQVNFFHYRDEQANGFYFHGESPWNSDDYRFFIQHLIDLLKKQDYRLDNTKKEVVEEEGQLRTLERFYLKPKLKFRTVVPYQQLYGNILIEHRIIEESTHLVKFMVNSYSDRNFQDPLDFENLMQKIWLS